MAASSTLILGGGFGGLAAAHKLRTMLPGNHTVTVVDKSPWFAVGAAKTWVMLGDHDPEDISRSREALLPGGVEFLEADIRSVDPAGREVVTTGGTLRADFLVFAMGADMNMAAVPGLATSARSFYTMEGAMQLRSVLKEFKGGDVVILIPRTPFKCPPAPYEASLLLHNYFRERGLLSSTRICMYTLEPAPMPTAGPEMGAFIRGLLQEQGIEFNPLKKTASVDGQRRTVMFEDGTETGYDLLIAVPPHEAPRVVRDAGLINQSGWIPVDTSTMKVIGAENSYAVGDITSVALPGRYKPDAPLVLPKAGVFAASQGIAAAHAIASTVLGKGPAGVFDGKGYCFIETGGGLAVRGEGSFFDLPHPSMSKQPPDKMQYRDKQLWVEQWLSGEAIQRML